jgi:penicillin amidase
MKKKFTNRVIASGIIAFLLYGSWAVYANNEYGLLITLRSGLTQGLLSMTVTMVMTLAMEKVFSRIKPAILRFILTALGPLVTLITLMAFVHWIVGTPRIIKTIFPSVVIGTIYCILYTLGLSKVKKINIRKLFYFLAALLLILIIILFIVQRATNIQTQGIIHVEGLQGPVFIYRDSNGIPHIVAEKSDQDAFFALGFVQAQDRLWQMEFQRHVVSGTLSEIFGKKTIEADEFLRIWGFYRAAKTAWPALDIGSQSAIKHYTAGVNAEISQGHLPLQISLLHYQPKPWDTYDSIAWQKMMAWQLQSSWEKKIKNYIIAQNYGIDKIPYFMPHYPANSPTTLSAEDLIQAGLIKSPSIKTQAVKNLLPKLSLTNILNIAQNVHAELGYLDFPSKGSNAWVVSGKLTQSGLPILANDIHLALTAPSLWYLVEMKGPTIHVIGASIPGLPAIVVGHNDHIAWGITNGYNDAQDLFIIPSHEKTKTLHEIIYVKGENPIDYNVHISSHGPIISDVTPNMKDLPIHLALEWPALKTKDTTIRSFIDLQYAKNWTSFVNALSYFVTPTQNFVYADIKGNIGYYYPGKLPVREGFSGALPVDNKYHWSGYIPFNSLPHIYNPKKNFIATANNPAIPDIYPYSLAFRWPIPPYRIERIQDLLKNNGIFTVQKFMAFQGDNVSYFWRDLKSELLTIKPLDQLSKKGLIILQNWDGSFSVTSEAATIFAYWLKQFNDLWPQSLAFGDKWLEPLYLKEKFSDPRMQRYLSQSFKKAMVELIKNQGNNPINWQWGKIHKAIFNEVGLGQSKLIGWLWNRSISTAGGNYTINVGTYDPVNFSQIAGATYKQIIDMSDLSNSYYIQPLGESENIFSSFYTNFMNMWSKGEYLKMTQYQSPCDPKQPNCLELLPMQYLSTSTH